ncbi:MAG TPA: phage holin family protein [Kofleriaceae bacterium]|nr:phage holin family protein [Kofleriaceae bacterium]
MAQFEDTMESERDEGNGRVGEILHQLTDDVKTIAHNEIELARLEMEKTAKTVATDAAAILLGGIVALIGLGLLSVSAVDALEPIIEPLWLRLVIMAVVYLVIGGAVAGAFARRLKRDVKPDMSRPRRQAQRTVDAVREAISND